MQIKTCNFYRVIILFTVLTFIFFASCKKNEEKITTALSPNEFINYTVNGIDYSYIMPGDLVLADTVGENTTFIPTSKVNGDKIPSTSTDYVRIAYDPSNIIVGSNQRLTLFAVPQTEIYPYYATSGSPVYISITEFGNVGAFIAGNFSGVITGSAPGNLQYSIACNFRVRRRI